MCTLEKRGRVFLLTLTGDDDHRLNPTLIDAVQASLGRVRAESTPGSVLITTAEGKFFSNGFDLNWAKAAGSGFYDRLNLMVSRFEHVMADLFSLPLPTIAAISGHSAAAGFMLALSHDYVLMRKDRGVLYMSELDIGLPFPDSFMALMRTKIPAPAVRRSIVLRAAKITAAKAVEMGIIDSAHDSAEETIVAALRLGEELADKKWNGDVYAGIRKAAFREVSVVLGLTEKGEKMTVAARL